MHGDAPLFLLVSLLASGTCMEFHKEYKAIHQTALWRRSKAKMGTLRQHHKDIIQVEISADGQSTQRKANISTTLQDMKTEFIGTIGVGTNKEGGPLFNARVVFDTGSTNLWVASTLCKSFPCNTDRAKQFYDPVRSLTAEPFDGVSGDIDILFGTGELRGPLHIDTYHVGPMVVKRQPFAMIKEMTGAVFSSFPFEGIVGLGFKSLSFHGITPFFDRVIEQKALTNNEFAFYLNVDSSKPSALLWGGVDKDLYRGPIRMFPVVQQHYWALKLLDFKVGDRSMKDAGMLGNPVKRLIIDSGTTYFTAPSGMTNLLMDQLPERGCDEVSDYPDLTYVLRGGDNQPYNLVINQETYMLSDERNQCRPAWMTLDVAQQYGPAMILGEVFMQHFFTVFSRGDGADENARIGIAPANIGAIPKQVQHPVPLGVAEPTTVLEKGQRERAHDSIVRRDITPHTRHEHSWIVPE
jgi:hypothetical protein